jgi:arginyl-tRNA synthetase
MLMREEIGSKVIGVLAELELVPTPEELSKIEISYPEAKFGDYSSNAALIMAKSAKTSPKDLAVQIMQKLSANDFEKIEIAGPGFINFTLRADQLIAQPSIPEPQSSEKILLEYFQPNIAKPLHVGHMENAIIGDSLFRMFEFLGANIHSDTHMGDWGTQFGLLILAYKKYGDESIVAKDPITELNKLYVQINNETKDDPELYKQAQAEFVKLEQGDEETKKTWKKFVDWSMEKFVTIDELIGTRVFEKSERRHHWPESFFEDKMPAVIEELKAKKLLVLSQGAQIVDLEQEKLGVAIIIKSDGGTTYLLRDLATFIFCKEAEGFDKHLYVVDNRQALHYRQLFVILKKLGRMNEGEGVHIDYGFISFKGEVLSTRKGNMVLAEDVIHQAEEKVAKIIEVKNPDLKNKEQVSKAVSKSALKYFVLSHNRHSDIEFDWDKVLDFEGDSGPYLQYSYARLVSILRKVEDADAKFKIPDAVSATEREILFKASILSEIVQDATKDYLPNILANYLYNFATLLNKFYHESPVTKEENQELKAFRLALISKAKATLKTGLDLLGIEALEEM